MVIDGLALHFENTPIRCQQIRTLHAWTTGFGAHQQGIVDVLEGDLGIIRYFDFAHQRECAVFQFHHHALECF